MRQLALSNIRVTSTAIPLQQERCFFQTRGPHCLIQSKRLLLPHSSIYKELVRPMTAGEEREPKRQGKEEEPKAMIQEGRNRQVNDRSDTAALSIP